MTELRGVIGDDVFTYDAPFDSHRNEVHRAVWTGNGLPRAAIVQWLGHWHQDSDELIDYAVECARLRALGCKHQPALYALVAKEGRIIGTVEEEVGEIDFRALLRNLGARGVTAPVGLALHLARALASAWKSLDDTGFKLRMSTAPSDVRLGWGGHVHLLSTPYPGPKEQLHGAAVAVMHGSFQWLSPEVITGAGERPTSAMFGIAMMMFEVLTQRYAFGDHNTLSILRALLEEPLPRLDERADVPPNVIALMERCAEKKPANRLGTWAALLDAIDEAARSIPRFAEADLGRMLHEAFPAEAAQARARAKWIERMGLTTLEVNQPRLPKYDLELLPISMLPSTKDDEMTPTPAIRSRERSVASESVVWGLDARAMVYAGSGLLVDLRCVTHDEYARFVIATGHPPPSDWDGPTPAPGMQHELVTRVSQRDAIAYATWAGKLLPTDDEWQRAVQGAGAERLCVGEVWELTASGFGEANVVVRGGRWRDRLDEPPSATNRSFEDRPAPDVGFRCVAHDE